jgi:hypothetical protein
MVLLQSMFKATSPATETTPVSYFFNHLSCSNAKGEAAGTRPKKEAELFTLASTHWLEDYLPQILLSFANLARSLVRRLSSGSRCGQEERSPIFTVGCALPRRMQLATFSHRFANARIAVRGCFIRDAEM